MVLRATYKLQNHSSLHSDTVYIEGFKRMDSKIYNDFVNHFSPRVYNTALGILQNKEDAEEVAQDVFIKIFGAVESFEGDASLSTWVYRITTNKALDALRSRKRRSAWTVFTNYFSDGGEVEHPAADFLHPGVLLEQQENARLLFKAIEQLPERQKAVFVLHKLEDQSYQEIAQIMELSTSAVDSLMSRARTNLKTILKAQHYG